MIRISQASQLNTITPWPDGTILDLQPGGRFDIANPIRGAGKLTILGNGSTLRNVRPVYVGDKKPGLATIESDKEIVLNNLTLEQMTSDGPQGWAGNRGVVINGGQWSFSKLWIANGDGVFVRRCDKGSWVGGGTSKSVYSYTLFLGSFQDSPSDIARNVYVEGVAFHNGRKEAGCRIMGGSDLSFVECSFTHDDLDPRPDHTKETFQPRVVKNCGVNKCTFTGSIEAGELAPQIDNGLHFRKADEWGRSDITFRDSKIDGYLCAAGAIDVTMIDTLPTGKDPRNIGDGKPTSTKVFSFLNKQHTPTIKTLAAPAPEPPRVVQPPPPAKDYTVKIPAGVKRFVVELE
jgi:hypothetical protein